jgi:hypothetical protein
MNKKEREIELQKAIEIIEMKRMAEYKGIEWEDHFECPETKTKVSKEYCESFASGMPNKDKSKSGCKFIPTCSAYQSQKSKENDTLSITEEKV